MLEVQYGPAVDSILVNIYKTDGCDKRDTLEQDIASHIQGV